MSIEASESSDARAQSASGAPDASGGAAANVAGAPSMSEGAAASATGAPSEAQLRAAYEAELSRITSADMALQAAASLLNIGAFRLGLTGGPDPDAGESAQRDLAQVRDAIDAVRGLLPVIERSLPQELRPLRDALSQLQMAYARAAQDEQAPPAPQAPVGEQAPSAAAPAKPATDTASEDTSAPGPAQASGRLWVPGR